MERVLPEAKFEKKCTSFFEFFGFERPLPRYLLKQVLHCKGSRIWGNAITEVLNGVISQCHFLVEVVKPELAGG